MIPSTEPFDVLIIGGGVVGCAIAREMSRYRLRIGVLEKEPDVGFGNSSRNSGVLHGGFTYKKGSLRAAICVEGNREFESVAAELDVPFRRLGKVVVGFTAGDLASLERFKAVGEGNGVEGLEIVDKARLAELDPSAEGEFALYSPASGILDPFAYTIALAENAARNGVGFYFGRKVVAAVRKEGFWELTAQGNGVNAGAIACVGATADAAAGISGSGGELWRTRWVVNAAGLHAAQISAMLGIPGYHIRGFKGEYIVLDKRAGAFLHMPVYPAPDEKGGFATHATPTIDGNVLIGPDSYITEDFEDFRTTRTRMEGLVRDGLAMFAQVKPEYFIRNFAGIRAKRVDPATGGVLDFVCESRDEAPGLINLVGIESPGLTGALPLARRAVALLAERESLSPNTGFDPKRKAVLRFHDADPEEKHRLIAADPAYGEIICRCETVSRAEILRAIHNPLGTATVASVKNRTRATMGRCQGGYCETRIAALLQSELGIPETAIRLHSEGSAMFTGRVRGQRHGE